MVNITARSSVALFLVVLQPLQGFVTPCCSIITGQTVGFASASSRLTQSSNLPTDMMRRRATTKGLASTGGSDESTPSEDGSAITDRDVLDSIRFCYKYAFIAGLVGFFSEIMEGTLTSTSSVDLNLVARLSVVLHQFAFGAGLYRVWNITDKLVSGKLAVTASSIYQLGKTMNRLWRQTAEVVIVGSMALSTTLNDSFIKLPPWAVVLTLALVGIVPLNMSATRASKRADANGNKPATEEYAVARNMGFTAARNQRLCMGAFGILSLVQIVTSLAQSSKITLGLGLLDVAESVAMVGLIASFNRDALVATVAVTDGSDFKPSDYVSLHETEKSFYDKVGDVFKTQAISKMIPYVVAAAKELWRVLNKG